ncbi:MAG TPA: hypothetical protein PKK06_16790 [Phycisphaerae bacterium]|nr:hypothetical protein [Phycisphaerae bacterium]HNU46845.1 hypothetical protein [Phycisphaerae bacterium]
MGRTAVTEDEIDGLIAECGERQVMSRVDRDATSGFTLLGKMTRPDGRLEPEAFPQSVEPDEWQTIEGLLRAGFCLGHWMGEDLTIWQVSEMVRIAVEVQKHTSIPLTAWAQVNGDTALLIAADPEWLKAHGAKGKPRGAKGKPRGAKGVKRGA